MNENISEELVRLAKEDWQSTMTTDDGAEQTAKILKDFMQCDVDYKKVDVAVLDIESRERTEMAKLEMQKEIEAGKRISEEKINSARLAHEEMMKEKEYRAAMVKNIIDGVKIVSDIGRAGLSLYGMLRSISNIAFYQTEGYLLDHASMNERKNFKF